MEQKKITMRKTSEDYSCSFNGYTINFEHDKESKMADLSIKNKDGSYDNIVDMDTESLFSIGKLYTEIATFLTKLETGGK